MKSFKKSIPLQIGKERWTSQMLIILNTIKVSAALTIKNYDVYFFDVKMLYYYCEY
jgi:hypothetical protein